MTEIILYCLKEIFLNRYFDEEINKVKLLSRKIIPTFIYMSLISTRMINKKIYQIKKATNIYLAGILNEWVYSDHKTLKWRRWWLWWSGEFGQSILSLSTTTTILITSSFVFLPGIYWFQNLKKTFPFSWLLLLFLMIIKQKPSGSMTIHVAIIIFFK